MKTIIHINQHAIRRNKKRTDGKLEPVISAKTYKSNRYAFEAVISGKNGEELAKVVYRPEKPLNCGATCWVETEKTVSMRKSIDQP